MGLLHIHDIYKVLGSFDHLKKIQQIMLLKFCIIVDAERRISNALYNIIIVKELKLHKFWEEYVTATRL